ncbi:MAG: hypothetical protein GF393_01570 [Armatimonadia bacterium]|nr:hypothetical protein [Armatimonadia bacterium]
MTAESPDRGGRATRLAPLVALLLVAWAALATASVFPVSDPDRATGIRYGIGLATCALLLGVLVWSARTERGSTRAWLGVAALSLSLGGVGIAYGEHFASHRILWWVLLPTLSLATVCAWRVGQQWLTVAVGAGILTVVVVALLPPRYTELPVTKQQGELTVTLMQLSESPYGLAHNASFVVTGCPRRIQDYEHRARAKSSIAGIIPLDAEDTPPYYGAVGGGHIVDLFCFPPDWTRTFDIELSIPVRPPDPAVSLEIPIPEPGEVAIPNLQSAGRGVAVTIRRLHSIGGAGVGRAIVLELAATGTDLLDPTAIWIGPPGEELSVGAASITGNAAVDEMELELEFPEDSDVLRVDVLSREQIQKAWRTFRFSRLSNPKAGESFGEPAIADLEQDTGNQP